jgi:hypothetical protein
VVVDYSASFAPLTQTDRLALLETARAIGNLATQDWPPPTTIVWRKIGTSSTAATPTCDIFEYKRSIVGAAGGAELLNSKLTDCVDSIVLDSRRRAMQEPFTDISGGVMMAAQDWAPMRGRKAIVVLSDFLEDRPKGSRAPRLELHGESVLLLHRPGTMESSNIGAYLARIRLWRDRFIGAGAHSAVTLPVFRATRGDVERSLNLEPGIGTTISLVSDLTPEPDKQPVVRAVVTVADAFAKAAAGWVAPVRAGWFSAGKPAWRTLAVAPIVYTPRITRHPNELNTTESFRVALEETGIALLKQNARGQGDIDGTLRLVSDDERALRHYLVVMSDFATGPPAVSDFPLRGALVVMIYRAGIASDGEDFFDRVRTWQQYFKAAGASSVCATDITTVTESVIESCIGSGDNG